MSRAGLAVAIGVSGTGLALAGCGSSARTSSPPTAAARSSGAVRRLSVVTHAAARTDTLTGARIRIGGSISAGGDSLTMQGTGVSSLSQGTGAMTFSYFGPIHESVKVVFDGYVFYASIPGQSLPNGATWAKIDYSKVVRGAGGNPESVERNPADTLARLRAAGSVEQVGIESLRSVPTTHYRATLDVSKLAAQQGEFGKKLAGLHPRFNPVDVWIDRDGYVRKETESFSIEISSETADYSFTTELYDFGTPVHVTIPAAGDVYDETTTIGSATNNVLGG